MKSLSEAYRRDCIPAQAAANRALPRAFRGTAPFTRIVPSDDLGHETEVMRALTLAVPISLALWVPLIAAALYLF